MASSRMLALLGLLAVAGYQNRDKLGELLGNATGAGNDNPNAPPDNTATQPGGGGILGSVLGGLFGGSAAGGSGDIRGGLGDLLDQFKGGAQAEKAKSWVESGPNPGVETNELEGALGEETIDALSRQTGLSREELLSRLKSVLPTAVDKLTPEGRLPTEAEVSRWTGR